MIFDQIFLNIANDYRMLHKGYFLLSTIPNEIRKQEIDVTDIRFADARYFFGDPFTINGKPFAIGTPQMPHVKMLFEVMHNARVALNEVRFSEFCKYLFQKEKHLDAIAEFRPIASAMPFLSVEHEVPGNGNHKIDWKFVYDDITILLDVKNRSGNTFRHLSGLSKPITTEPEEFFKSTEKKFVPNNTENILQGVWIHIGIKENKQVLSEYFQNNIDPKKIQFYVIAGWESNECYAEARTEAQKRTILEKFQLIETDRFVV